MKKNKIRKFIIMGVILALAISAIMHISIEPADYISSIKENIAYAQKLISEPEQGNDNRQYPEYETTLLKNAINNAQKFVNSPEGKSIEEERAAYQSLKDAIDKFKKSAGKNILPASGPEEIETADQPQAVNPDSREESIPQAPAEGNGEKPVPQATEGNNIENGMPAANEKTGSGGTGAIETNTGTGSVEQGNEAVLGAVAVNPIAGGSEEQNAESPEQEEDAVYCTVTIVCNTILDNMDDLTAGLEQYVPADGVILAETKVEVYEDESVFEVLKRVTRSNKIQMEFRDDPVYSGAYIEGINNLYEKDCGNESGWMYKVNGLFPNYGCSQYKVKEDDKIVWCYTCDLGRDVGDQYYDEH